MSPEHDNCRLPAHYLAKLIVHLSHISGNSARYNIRDVFLDRQGKRMLIPEAGADPLIEHPRGMSLLIPPL
jgi:hypothetical protein